MKVVFFILFVGVCYCFFPENGKRESGDITFSITPIQTIDESFYEKQGSTTYLFDENRIQMEISFSSQTAQKLLFDKFVFGILCPINTDDDIKLSGLKPKTVKEYFELVTRSQMLIENEKNELRMFTSFSYSFDPKKPKYRERSLQYGCGHDQIAEGKHEDIFEILPNKPDVDTLFIIKRHLKVNDEDKKVRLHYLFKPDERQQKLGFNKSYILTSNWFYLDE